MDLHIHIRTVGRWAAGIALATLAAAAAAQPAWQIESIAPATTLYVPPALIFDAQNIAHVVVLVSPSSLTNGDLQHFYAAAGGTNPAWNGPLDTTIPRGGGGTSAGRAVVVAAGGATLRSI